MGGHPQSGQQSDRRAYNVEGHELDLSNYFFSSRKLTNFRHQRHDLESPLTTRIRSNKKNKNKEVTPNPRREGIATYSVFEVIWGPTNGRTDGRTNGRTNIVSYRGATLRLKRIGNEDKEIAVPAPHCMSRVSSGQINAVTSQSGILRLRIICPLNCLHV
jgi:hypothetical protein